MVLTMSWNMDSDYTKAWMIKEVCFDLRQEQYINIVYKASRPLLGASEPPINPLKTKRRLRYLKTQFVPRSKHFSSRL